VTTARQLIEVLDTLGVEWPMVRADLELVLEPSRSLSVGEYLNGWDVILRLEIPAGLLDQGKVRAAAQALEGWTRIGGRS